MAETQLVTTRAAVVACLATSSALDGLPDALRTAPDEALVFAAPNAADDRCAEAEAALAATDPSALVADVSDAWSGLTLTGAGARDLFAHLSQLHLPERAGFIQGDVGRLVAKVIVKAPGDRITIFVPSPQSHVLRDRIRALGAIERPDPETWSQT